MDPNTRIAGDRRVSDWLEFRDKLVLSRDAKLWRAAGTDYFYERIRTRYMAPIHAIQSREEKNGEGFSIVTIQCALLEFLAATTAGKNFRFSKPIPPHEYSNSRELFEGFLLLEAPFASQFTKETASDFYASVRCGLLHETQTKNGWTIKTHRAGTSKAIDSTGKILYRHRFHSDLELFIKTYRERLTREPALQDGFIRKFDYICGIEPPP